MLDKLKKYRNIIIAIAEITLGILLLINPTGFTSGIIKIVGIIFTIMGAFDIAHYIKLDVESAIIERSLSSGLFKIVIGLFCSLNSSWFINTLPVATSIYGIILLYIGINKIQWTFDLLRLKSSKWYYFLISSFLSLATAVIVLTNIIGKENLVWIMIGIILIASAVLDMVGQAFATSDKEKNSIIEKTKNIKATEANELIETNDNK